MNFSRHCEEKEWGYLLLFYYGGEIYFEEVSVSISEILTEMISEEVSLTLVLRLESLKYQTIIVWSWFEENLSSDILSGESCVFDIVDISVFLQIVESLLSQSVKVLSVIIIWQGFAGLAEKLWSFHLIEQNLIKYSLVLTSLLHFVFPFAFDFKNFGYCRHFDLPFELKFTESCFEVTKFLILS